MSKSFHVFTTKKTKVKKIAQYLEIHGKKINNNNNNNNKEKLKNSGLDMEAEESKSAFADGKWYQRLSFFNEFS